MNQADTMLKVLGLERCTFQTKPDFEGGGFPHIYHGPHFAVKKNLEKDNEAGCGVHFCVHPTDLRGRKTENILSVGSYIADDIKLLDDYPLEPTVVVETSPGNYSAMWRVIDAPKESYVHVLEHIALILDGDKSGLMLNKTMRLAGYLHKKRQPFLSQLVFSDANNTYRYHDFLEMFCVPEYSPPKPVPTSISSYLNRNNKKTRQEGIQGNVVSVRSAQPGQRNEVLFKQAAAVSHDVVKGKIKKEDAYAQLLGAALESGLDQYEAKRTIESAWSYRVN